MADRRDFIRTAAIVGASLAARVPIANAQVPSASKPLDLLILGGTGLTGPHQVRYPLAVTQQEFAKDVGRLYGALKTASEREAKKWFGDRTTIIRPTLIVGPGDETFRFTYWPYRIATGGEILAPGDGQDLVQIIDCRDLAEWTIRAVENASTGTFNAAGPASPMTMAEQLHGIRAAFDGNREVRFTWVPADFLAAQKIAPWGDMPTWIPRQGSTAAIMDVDNPRAIAAGLTFRPLARSAVDALEWFRAAPPDAQAKLRKAAGLPPERERAMLDAWHRASGAQRR